MPEDAMWLAFQERYSDIYDEIYYRENPLVAYVNNSGHSLMEQFFSPDDWMDTVLEVGAGTGQHLAYVRHRYGRYIISDLSENMLAKARERHAGKADVEVRLEDATRLSLPDGSVDRLISVYNLEHLPEPHLVLKEWARVVRKGGALSIAIPAEGGVAWRLGRFLSTRRAFARRGLDLDYLIAREHINTCYNLVAFINHYFPVRQEVWFPMRVPITDVNLVYACRITVP